MRKKLTIALCAGLLGGYVPVVRASGPVASVGAPVETACLSGTGEVGEVPSETEFGRRVLETWKSAGIELPMPEEAILRLKPGVKRLGTPPEAEFDPDIRFTGFLQYSEVGGKIRLPYGFYTFAPKSGLKRELYKDVEACLNGGGVYFGNRLHGMSAIPLNGGEADWQYYEWDADTWKLLSPSGIYSWGLISLACDYDPVTGCAYGFGKDALLQFDYDNHTSRKIAAVPFEAAAMAINRQGECYVLTKGSDLYKVRLADGDYELVGKIDFVFYPALQSMTFDSRTGKLYLAASEGNYEEGTMYGRLCEISLEDASTKLVGYFPDHEEYTVLRVIHDPEEGAPGAIRDLRAVYTSSDLSGRLIFTMPEYTFAGDALAGDVKYSVYVNDSAEPVSDGTGVAGEQIAVDVVPSEGRTKYVVVLSNENGEGERNAIESWGGADAPAAAGLAAVADNASGSVTLTWDVDAVGANGGFTDRDGVTYEVRRFPEGVVLTDDPTPGTYRDDISAIPSSTYYYTVTPCKDGERFGDYESNHINGGVPRTLPYDADLRRENASYDFWMVDANQDGSTWFERPNAECPGIYNAANAYMPSDDWMLSPEFGFKANTTYEISAHAISINGYEQAMEAAVGSGLDPVRYEKVLDRTKVTGRNEDGGDNIDFTFVCKESGNYRVGLHDVSDANLASLIIDRLRITEGYDVYSPASPANMEVIPGENGNLEALVAFDAPDRTVGGYVLDSMDRITLYRGDGLEYVGEVEDPVPGFHYAIRDDGAMNGNLKYTLVASNASGSGKPISMTRFIGIDEPVSPDHLEVTDNLDGTYTLSWSAPCAGINGGYVDADEILYKIYTYVDGLPSVIASDVESTEYRLENLSDADAQSFVFFMVSAMNDVGESGLVEFPLITLGKPYDTPFCEGFVATRLASIWMPETINGKWSMYSSGAPDNDGYIMGFKAQDYDAHGSILSGKISIKDVAQPKVAFSFYGYPGKDAWLTLKAGADGRTPEQLLSIDFKDLEGPEGWRICVADISRFTGSEYINLMFDCGTADPDQCQVIYIDDVNVRNVPEHNLELTMQAQNRTTAGDSISLDMVVYNVGFETEDKFGVDVYVNDSYFKTLRPGTALNPFDRTTLNCVYETTALSGDNLKVRAEIVSDTDMMDADNVACADVHVEPPFLNPASNLVVKESDGAACLSWDAPSQDNVITDSFEGYRPFKYDGFGQWTVHDGDGQTPYPVISVDYPGNYTPASFFTVDFTSLGFDESVLNAFVGHTGTSFMACVRPNSLMNDDWVFSPELSGNAQTISLFAQSQGIGYEEVFTILASAKGNAREDFEEIASYAVDSEYAEYTAALPEGTKYFAIHCTSMYGGMLMIDDVTMEVAPRTLVGFNVYRDRQLVGSVRNECTEYVDAAADRNARYVVTALYEEGESAPSNPVSLSGVNETIASDTKISAADGVISIFSPSRRPVSVWSIDGICVYSGNVDGTLDISTCRGVYIVKVGSYLSRIIVD